MLKRSQEVGTELREEFRVPGLSVPISHYTDAVRFGNIVFISGVAPLDESGKVVGVNDVVAQTQQIFRNLKSVLEAIGASPSDVLRITVYLTNVEDRALINPLRQKFFGTSLPASTLIGVQALALPEMKIEIEAVVGLTQRVLEHAI